MFTSFGFKPWGGVGGGLVTFTQSVLSICQVIGFFFKGCRKRVSRRGSRWGVQMGGPKGAVHVLLPTCGYSFLFSLEVDVCCCCLFVRG